ncbi:DUF1217 domain-containing protein [Profundibacterium mesophilum]|uniref:Flagellar protein n=1 Tax=Profundibacterium mesophilum KAUST100406-0324 TaxID=1037889 RepID=A0A921NSJ6_9RHOB|nr:DUF1217 domain-containing protein [Profundibacterium mesophilum]KAF0674635.1 hypothetical protein PMES_03017 [Profundibacterium mesophilum KAUST100406-0324]
MIPLGGLSTQLGLSLVDATRDRQEELIRNTVQNARSINAFRERIADVETVDQLIEDRELYTFVMKAFDLEDQIFGKALIGKMLKSNIEEPDALVNRLSDPRFREMYQELGFGTDGTGNLNTILFKWQERMVDRFVDRQFINAQTEQNETLGIVLEFRAAATKIETPFDILKNADLSRFMRRALGIPDSAAGLDIDRQAALFTKKFDLEKLQDPAEVRKLERKFVAVSDALDTERLASNAAVQLMRGAVQAGAGGGFTPITLNIEAITASPIRYR